MLHSYKDKSAIAAHGKAPEFREMGEKLKGLLSKPMQAFILSEIGGFKSRL